jgi:hypothetical protein
MYKLQNCYMAGQVTSQVIIKTNSDGTVSSFVKDPANTDYQKYLEWVAAGNTPLPADGE